MTELKETMGYQVIQQWLESKGYQPFAFQEEAWEQILAGQSGLVNARTGCGKTFSVFLGALIDFINRHPTDFLKRKRMDSIGMGQSAACTRKDIGRDNGEVVIELGMSWNIGIRMVIRKWRKGRDRKDNARVLIITPESLHLLLAQRDYPLFYHA
jgi:ATP-dependent Lhr-like helicase